MLSGGLHVTEGWGDVKLEMEERLSGPCEVYHGKLWSFIVADWGELRAVQQS